MVAPHTNARWYTEWTTWAPVLAGVALALSWGSDPSVFVGIVLAVLMGAAVISAVHHAEVIALKVGEPYGSLVLAVAVTVIEVGLIVTLMSSGGEGTSTLARDTVFGAFMITINLVAGLALLINAGRRGFAHFRAQSSGAMLAAVATLAVLTMVVPNYTSGGDKELTPSQLVFAAVASLAVYFLFVATQTRSHRDFFLPVTSDGDVVTEEHVKAPGNRTAFRSLGLLLLSLVAVVGLAKTLSHLIEDAIGALGLPHAFVGVVIAMLVLAPETLAAANTARRDRVQTAINLAYGSAMASIGLTIPVMAVLSLAFSMNLQLGLDPIHIVLMVLSLLVATLTVVPGRATKMTAGIHLVIFAAYVFLSASP